MPFPYEKIERKILVKKQAETSLEYGYFPEKRSVEQLIQYGVININKPEGPTSHQVSEYVKKILSLKKCGHSGSLDPHVTGVLPIALEKVTRIAHYLLTSGKEYVGLMHLHNDIPEDQIRYIAQQFIGKIKQLPPVRSAVKRRVREREIYYLDILEIEGRDILFRIGSEAGFYVRKFCHDFGLQLRTKAHMVQLVRTKVGYFTDKNWSSLHDVKDAYEFYKEGDPSFMRKAIFPFEKVVDHFGKIWVLDSCVDSLCHGSHLSLPGISRFHSGIEKGDVVAILTLKDELICMGKALMNSLEIEKNFKGRVVKTDAVFMEREMYPKNIRDTT